MKKLLIIIALVLQTSICVAQYAVYSPNGELSVSLNTNKSRKGASKFLIPTKMTMKVSKEAKTLSDAEIGLTVKSKGRRYAFGKANIIRTNKGERMLDHPETRDTLLSNLTGRYNVLYMATDNGMMLEVRVYDDGVAYRFKISDYPEDYKILEVCDVFPEEKPIAILGTFEGEYTLPWRTMKVEKTVYNGKKSKIPTTTYSDALNRGTRFVPWKDALSSVSVGISFDWHHGDTWGDFSDMQSFRADFTYKHIYGGVDFASCTQILYIPWGEDYWPFEKVIKDIDAWRVGIRGGYCIPLQNGYEIWSIIPYVATSVMHLHQHGATRPNFKPLDMHNHWLVGPGVKVQLAHREGIMLGAGYECQFFLDKKSPTAMSSLTFSIGKMF